MICFSVKNLMGKKNQSTILESKSQLDAFHGWAHFKKALAMHVKWLFSRDAFLGFRSVFPVTRHKNAHTSNGWNKHTALVFKLLSGAQRLSKFSPRLESACHLTFGCGTASFRLESFKNKSKNTDPGASKACLYTSIAASGCYPRLVWASMKTDSLHCLIKSKSNQFMEAHSFFPIRVSLRIKRRLKILLESTRDWLFFFFLSVCVLFTECMT